MINTLKCTICRLDLTFEQEVFTLGADCYRLRDDCSKMVHNYIIHLEDEIKEKRK